MRVAAALAFITACAALSLDGDTSPESRSWSLGDSLDRLGRHVSKGFENGEEVTEIDKDVLAAEAAAKEAREQLAEVLAEEREEHIANLSERQLDTETRVAEAQWHRTEIEEGMLDRVGDAMAQEIPADERYVADAERQALQLSAAAQRISRDVKVWKGQQEEGGEWRDESEDPVIKREEKRERREDRAFAQEEKRAAKLMKHALQESYGAVAKEKKYQRTRGAAEREIQARLGQEADAMCQAAAANGTLSQDELLEVLDMTKEELIKITTNLTSFSSDASMPALWIEQRLNTSRWKAISGSAHMVEAIRRKVETLKTTHSGYDDHQFLAMVAALISETLEEFKSYGQLKDTFMSRLQGWDKSDGEKLTYKLAQVIQGVTGSAEFKSHLLRIDTARLAHANMSEACDVLGDLVHTSMLPAFRSIGLQRDALDKMSQIVPTITASLNSYIQKKMADRAAAMLSMAYVEHLALKESALAILKEASPVVAGRLHCTISGASQRSGFGVAVVAAAVAWLAQ